MGHKAPTKFCSLAKPCMKETMAFLNCLGLKPEIGGLYINPKQFGTLAKPCLKETAEFLNCLALSNDNVDKCVRQKDLLMGCMDAQAGKNKKPFGRVNHQLQRPNKGNK